MSEAENQEAQEAQDGQEGQEFQEGQEARMGQSSNYDDMEFEMAGAEYGATSQASTKGVEDNDIEEAEDQFSHLGESSDDPDQRRRYMEYLELIKEIDFQNRIIEDLKTQIMAMCAKPCKTRCEMQDIKRLRNCMEQENLKLQCLMNKAMQLQNFGSHRRYLDLPIATTLDEDNMAPYVGTIPPQSTNWKSGQSSESEKPCVCEEKQDKRSKLPDEKCLRSLCQILGQMQICNPDDKKLMQEIVALLCPCKKPKRTREPCSPCPHHQQQQQQPKRHRTLKIKCPHQQRQSQPQSMPCIDSMEKLKLKIMCMQNSVNQLKQEICQRSKQKERQRESMSMGRDPCQEKPRECVEDPDVLVLCGGKRSNKSEELQKMKDNYLHLLSEFAKKDCQLKDMNQRMKGMCGGCGGGGGGSDSDRGNADQAELRLLRTRVNEMKEEQVEFKCIMKEQSQQLEDYRQKYLAAQQKVEEQSVTLDKLNMNNKRIEKQINIEIKEIRNKFQDKLNELLHFPKMLENEQLKLAQACKEKEDLQCKLGMVCKELKTLKEQSEGPKKDTDCRPQLHRCQMELQQVKAKLTEAEQQRDLFCEQLKNTQDDLDTLRCESAKIIARTKERCETTKQQLQEQINRLEKELAQCRATACLSVSDREAVIRDMQGQLNTLSYSFDAAQKQIKTLRNHIAYVSNENCYPVKC